jgi:2-phosphosulfolactate phosphatase
MTTTNGTRALTACRGAGRVWVGSFLNLNAAIEALYRQPPDNLTLVCAGTHDEAALEDTLAAGAYCDRLWPLYSRGRVSDAARMARDVFRAHAHDLFAAVAESRNGRRLLSIPDLAADVALCLAVDSHPVLAQMNRRGEVESVESSP